MGALCSSSGSRMTIDSPEISRFYIVLKFLVFLMLPILNMQYIISGIGVMDMI